MTLTFNQLILDEEAESGVLDAIATTQALLAMTEINAQLLGTVIKKSQQQVTQASKTDTLRTDMEFFKYITDLRSAAIMVSTSYLSKSLIAGFKTDLTGRAEIQSTTEGAMEFEVDITDEDIQALTDYPVLGHTVLEIAYQLADDLKFNVIRAVTGPLRGDYTMVQLPKQLEIEYKSFADKVGKASSASYLAGTSASQELVKGAIANAIKN